MSARSATAASAALAAWLLPLPLLAQQSELSLPSSGSTLHTLLLIAAFSLLPFVLLTTTSFVKLAIVLSVLRNAFGVSQLPSGAVVTALAAILTAYVMAPVASQIAEAAGPAAARVDLDHPLRGDSGAALQRRFQIWNFY